jgi:hypothetical protein
MSTPSIVVLVSVRPPHLELDVVRIAENQRRPGRGVRDRRVLHAVGAQVRFPVVQVRSLGHGEPHVVQPDASFVEAPLRALRVRVESDDQTRCRGDEHDHGARRQVDAPDPLEPEDSHVPLRAGLDIGHR